MSTTTKSVLITQNAATVGGLTVSLHAMVNYLGGASIAIGFQERLCGLEAGFHGSTDDFRALAEQLIKHADAADSESRNKEAA